MVSETRKFELAFRQQPFIKELIYISLFKILHGDASHISLETTPFHEGWCYVTHDGYMYIDINVGTNASPNNQRIKLNANDAVTLSGKTLAELVTMIDQKVATRTQVQVVTWEDGD